MPATETHPEKADSHCRVSQRLKNGRIQIPLKGCTVNMTDCNSVHEAFRSQAPSLQKTFQRSNQRCSMYRENSRVEDGGCHVEEKGIK